MISPRSWVSRIRSLFSHSEADSRLDEELQAHLEMLAEQNMQRGMSPENARRAARQELGGAEQIKESVRDQRGFPFLESVAADIRYAARTLRKSPGFTIIAVLTLALGIGANTAIFSVIDADMLRPLPYKSPSRLVELTEGSDLVSVPAGDFLDWQKQARSFQGIAAVADLWRQAILTGAGAPDQVFAARASSDFFQVLGDHAALGEAFLPGNPQGVVLSDYYWRAHFAANPRIIGQAIELDGKPFTIVGVMPPDFFFARSNADIWTPLVFSAAEAANYTDSSLAVIARLRSGVTRQQAAAEMQVLDVRLARLHGKAGGEKNVALAPLTLPQQDSQTYIFALLGAVIFTLLIACANVASMFLARGTARHRETAVRAALGAGRGRLMRQLLTESMIVSGLGAIAGLFLAAAGLRTMNSLVPSDPRVAGSLGASINLPVLGFTFGLCLVTGVLVGLMPAWKSARLDLSESLKEGAPGAGVSAGRFHAQGALVVLEVALSLILLIGAGLMVETFHRLMTVHTGFDPSHVLTVRIPLVNYKYSQGAPTVAFYDRILQRIGALPGVKSVAVTNNFPLSGGEIMLKSDAIPGSHSNQQIVVELKDVSPGFFQTMGIPLLRGRSFTTADTGASQQAVIVNQSMARRYWPGRDPLGKPLIEKWVIVGIVGDTVQDSLRAAPAPTVYRPYAQQPVAPAFVTLVLCAGGDPLKLVPAVRSAIGEIDPDQPLVQIRTMDDVIAESVWQPRFSASILSLLAVLALLLSAVGIYGVISYLVSQRTHEIGIRMALGAQQSDVLRLVIGHGVTLTLIGLGIGIAGAFGLMRFLSSQLFGVKPTDPLTFLGVALLLIAVALLACYIPARRAMRVDPMVALRHE